MTIPELPTELWLNIASFLSSDELFALHPLNQLFLRLAFSERYRIVIMKQLLQPETTKLLQRLEDPFVAQFVQSLTLDISVSVITSHEDITPSRLFSVVRHVLSGLVHTSAAHSDHSNLAGVITNRLLLAQRKFINLTALDLQFWGPTFDVELSILMQDIWMYHGHRLKKLAFGGSLSEYPRVLPLSPSYPTPPSSPSPTSLSSSPIKSYLLKNNPRRSRSQQRQFALLPNLEDLTVKFCEETLDSDILRGQLASFLNQVRSQLSSFTLLSWASGSLECLLVELEPFSSKLERLRIRVPYNQALETGDALTSLLLERSESVTDLELRLNPLGAVFDPSSENPLAQWMAANFIDNPNMLPRLHTLDIYPSRLLHGWEATLAICHRSHPTLRKLTLRDRYFLLDEIKLLMQALAPGDVLEYLRINVKIPGVELMDLLAKSLPNLQRLQLYFGNGGAADMSLATFKKELDHRQYVTWHLRELEMWQSGHRIHLDDICNKQVARCFPWVISSE